MALSRIDTTNMIEDVPQSKIDNNINFRNIIINGDMSIAQRGVDINDVAHGGYCNDRFRFHKANTGELVMNFDQVTDVPSSQGFSNSLKLSVGTVESATASNELVGIGQRIEAQNLQYLKYGTSSAETLTLCFWVKSSVTGTYAVLMFQQDASSSPDRRYYSKTFTISSANTWEKKTIQITGNQDDTIANDNGIGLDFRIILSAGSSLTSGSSGAWGSSTNSAVGQTANFSGTSSATFFLTGIQLEAGTSASDFEFLPVDVNKNRCLRYCFKHGGEASTQYLNAQGGYYDANYIAFGLVSPPVPMRSAPSLTVNGTVIVHRLNTDYTGWTWGFISGVQSQSWFVSANKSSHGVTAQHSLIKCATTSDFFIYDSEL